MKYENVTMKGNANEFRFSLTKEGNRKLVVFGVNPSTANEQIADLTITKVMGFAERNGFDGFIMLNLYPQRCTNPESLDKEIDEELQRKKFGSNPPVCRRYERAHRITWIWRHY